MFKTLSVFFLLLSIGFVTAFCQSNPTTETAKGDASQKVNDLFQVKFPSGNEASKPNDPSFDLNFKLERIDFSSAECFLSANINFPSGSFVISPYSKDDFYMPFDLSFDESDHFVKVDSLREIPKTFEEFDTIIQKQVRFVRGNTIYKQKIKLQTKEDFEVTGRVEFLLEPICIPYIVDFVISQNEGVMKIKKTKTRTHPSYKGR